MKTKEEILNSQPVFLNNWSDEFGVIADFHGVYIDKKDYEATESPYPNKEAWIERKAEMDSALQAMKGIKILFASYGTDNYSGDAFVLYSKNGELYESTGGHCSCYGLEGQWGEDLTPVVLSELENRLVKGTFGQDDYSGNTFSNELKEFLGI